MPALLWRRKKEAQVRHLHRHRVPGEPFQRPLSRSARTLLRWLRLEARARENFLRIGWRECSWDLRGKVGLRLLHASDFHLDFNRDLPDRLAACVGNPEVNASVLTGDFFDLVFRPAQLDRGLLRALVEVFPEPRYAVLGNHDILAVARLLESMEVRVLLNEGVNLSAVPGGAPSLWLAGIDDAQTFGTDSLERAMAGRGVGQPCVLLSHSPLRYRQAAAAGVDLYLCGHTHGGQIAPPWPWMPGPGGGLSVRRRSGPWKFRGMQGYTTNGCGGCKLPYRLNAPPEWVLHDLRPARRPAAGDRAADRSRR